jgi:predicted nucleic acid-binding protein
MKGLLLDTNVISEARKGSRCHERVARWLERHATADHFTSAICLMEIRLGIELLRRKQPEGAARLEAWFVRDLLPTFAGRILPVDTAVAEACGKLHAARPRSFRDALIGATAQCHQLIMVTRNTADYTDMDVTVINPWEA